MYLTILNLPRGTRNKAENVVLVGLILGPHEPQRDINSFLEPLVSDLLQLLWTGVEYSYSYNAHLGCSCCWKRFSGAVDSMDFSGFDRCLRTGTEHRRQASHLLSINNELERAESECGCRYPVLLRLPYFDAPRMLIIDPMHNLDQQNTF